MHSGTILIRKTASTGTTLVITEWEVAYSAQAEV